MARTGWVAGDIIASTGDPGRGRWLSVWGSAYRAPELAGTREAAIAGGQRGRVVAHVTEHPMPGASLGYCYRITEGTLARRDAPGEPAVDIDGGLVSA